MNKAYVNYILTIVMIVLGIVVLVTGVMLWYSFTVLGGQVKGPYAFKKHPYRNVVRNIHLYAALTLFGVCLLHFILNIDWFIAMTKRIGRGRSGGR